MIKKQYVLILTTLGVIISGLVVFKTNYFNINQQSPDNTTNKNTGFENTSNKKVEYTGKYFSLNYPENWDNLSNNPDANDRSLEPFVIRSFPSKTDENVKTIIRLSLKKMTPEMVDIHKFSESFEKDREINKDDNRTYFEASSNQEILGYPASIITEKFKNRSEHGTQYPAHFSKIILFYRNNIRYYITYDSYAPTEKVLNKLTEQELPVFEDILKSIKFQ